MRKRSLNQEFVRFRKAGDLAALGRVFDAVSTELLTVAGHLVSGPVEAEDLVQEVFVSAMERADRYDAKRPLLPWLVGLLVIEARRARDKRSRSVDLREPRERSEPEPSDTVQAQELDEAIVRVLADLPEPYRGVLDGHLIRGERAQEIAKRVGRPPGTVRVQIHRGLELLRQRLSPSFAAGVVTAIAAPRGLAAVRADLLELAGQRVVTHTIPGGTALILGGSLAVKKLLFVGLGTAALLFALPWLLPHEGVEIPAVPGEQVSGASVLTAEDQVEAMGGRSELAEVSKEGATSETQPVAASTPAGVAGRVVFESGNEPAVGVGVFLERQNSPGSRRHYETCKSDAEGRFTFDDVHAGAYRLFVDRGGEEAFTLDAGETYEPLLTIPVGVDVSGIVVNKTESPVPGAAVWLSFPYRHREGSVVAQADEQGRFNLRSVRPHCSIGARGSGYAPSMIRSLDQPVPSVPSELSVRIVLEDAGGDIAGRVVDKEGAGIVGARVKVGPVYSSVRTRNDGVVLHRGAPVHVETDANGDYLVEGAVAGETRISVSADGFAIWTSSTLVQPALVSRVEVMLERGVLITGTVTGVTGKPAAGVRVVARRASHFPGPAATTDASGGYTLTSVPSGEIHWIAYAPEGTAEETRTASDGAKLVWNVRLGEGRVLAGQALDVDGKPLADWYVFATPVELFNGPNWRRTDAAGRFRFVNCAPDPLRLELRPTAFWNDVTHAALDDVRPGGGEVVLQITPESAPAARVRGVVVNESGEALGSVRVFLTPSSDVGTLDTASDSGTGAFALGPMRGMRFTLSVLAPGRRRFTFAEQSVENGEDLDLGALVLPDLGGLVLNVQTEDGGALTDLRIEVRDHESTSLPMEVSGEISGSVAMNAALNPGPYRATVRAAGYGLAAASVTVAPGREAEAEITLASGRETTFRVLAQDLERRNRQVDLIVKSDGERVLVSHGHAFEGELERWERLEYLAAGNYAAEIVSSISGERLARTTFKVGVAREPVTVELRCTD